MGRPRHTKQDGNQPEIEDQLKTLGFTTLRVSDLASSAKSDAHFLDLFVLGMHRGANCPIWSQWEIKISVDAPVTEGEMLWLVRSKYLYGEDVPVNTAYSVDDVLKWYGWC